MTVLNYKVIAFSFREESIGASDSFASTEGGWLKTVRIASLENGKSKEGLAPAMIPEVSQDQEGPDEAI